MDAFTCMNLEIAPYDAVGIIIEEMTRERLKYDKARVISFNGPLIQFLKAM